jgi:hypothetical protein
MSLRSFISGGLVLGLLSSGLLGGCGDSDSGTGTGGTGTGAGPTIDQLPALFAKAVCDRTESCFGPAYAVFARGEDCTTATTKSVAEGDLAAAAGLVASGKLTYDPAKAQACLDAYKKLTCAELDNPSPAACEQAFGGKGAPGDACTTGSECGPGSFCEAGAACPGKCAAKKGAGLACTRSEGCEPGLHCDGSGKCAARVADGAACGAKLECEVGSLCLGDSKAKAQDKGTCTPSPQAFSAGIGAACDLDAGPFCAAGTVCQLGEISATGATFTCAAPVTTGKACRLAVPDACPADEYCPTDATAKPPVFDGVCTKRPAAGQPCGASVTGGVCAPYAVCRRDTATPGGAGTCVDKQSVGGTCQESNECYSGLCKAGVCAQDLACEAKR